MLSGGSCKTTRMYLMSLNSTHKMNKTVNLISYILLQFLKQILFIYYYREGEGVRKTGRNTDVQGKHRLVASHMPPIPTRDLAHNPSMRPNQESNRQLLGSQDGVQSTKPHQPGLYFTTI